MSFGDEIEPVRPTHVIWKCRRCCGLHAFEASEPEAELRRLVADNRTVMTLQCQYDGALAVGELVSVAPGVWPPLLPERPEPEVVIKEKRR